MNVYATESIRNVVLLGHGAVSYTNLIALSDVCDVSTANMIKREVSDGVIAPGYEPEALEILKSKKRGNYNVIQIDPAYIPAPIEKKQVFGITFEQGKMCIRDSLLYHVPRVPKSNTLSYRHERLSLIHI